MTGFEQPNHTQVPNLLFDKLLAEMSHAELLVTLVIIRKTKGWHKQQDYVSLSQLQKATGLSRQGVLNGVEAMLARGLIHEAGTGKRGVKCYALTVVEPVNEVDQQSATSQHNRPELVNQVDQTGTSTSQRSRHTEIKELKKGKERTPRAPKITHPLLQAFRDAYSEIVPNALAAPEGHAPAATVKLLAALGVTPDEVRALVLGKNRANYRFDFLPDDIRAARAAEPQQKPTHKQRPAGYIPHAFED